MNIRIETLLVCLSILVLAMTATATFNTTDSNTAIQVSSFTIPITSGTYVGAIRISDIDPTKIDKIIVTSNTYILTVNITTTHISTIPVSSSFNSTFKDLIKNTTETVTFSQNLPSSTQNLEIPQIDVKSNGEITIKNGFVRWDNNNILFYNDWNLINSNLLCLSLSNCVGNNVTQIIPSQYVNIIIQGNDKVDVTYYVGTLDKISESNRFIASKDSLLSGLIKSIPYVGTFIEGSLTFLASFFYVLLKALEFLVTGFDIIVLTYFTFTMIHGIMIMSAGGTPFAGIIVLVTDFGLFIKFIILMVTLSLGLLWRIILAIASSQTAVILVAIASAVAIIASFFHF